MLFPEYVNWQDLLNLMWLTACYTQHESHSCSTPAGTVVGMVVSSQVKSSLWTGICLSIASGYFLFSSVNYCFHDLYMIKSRTNLLSYSETKSFGPLNIWNFVRGKDIKCRSIMKRRSFYLRHAVLNLIRRLMLRWTWSISYFMRFPDSWPTLVISHVTSSLVF